MFLQAAYGVWAGRLHLFWKESSALKGFTDLYKYCVNYSRFAAVTLHYKTLFKHMAE